MSGNCGIELMNAILSRLYLKITTLDISRILF